MCIGGAVSRPVFGGKPPKRTHIQMIVIVRTGHWEFIPSPQNSLRAWELADRLTEETGILHLPYRI